MRTATIGLFAVLTASAAAQGPEVSKEVEAVYPQAHALYLDLHENPELSSHETQTAAKLASRLRSLGYDITEHVGGTGVVAMLRNGSGPTVMLRTELDALPVEEKTGLNYASKVHTKDDVGRDVPVMHACGHDLHMASLTGTAAVMVHSKQTWHGTLILIGQPAEETISGARSMIDAGLFKRFPRPDVAVALHVDNLLPAGNVGITPGNYEYQCRLAADHDLRQGWTRLSTPYCHRSDCDGGHDDPGVADHCFPRSEAGRDGRGDGRIHPCRDQEQHHSGPG